MTSSDSVDAMTAKERYHRKRIAATIRQRRCRARKREAKMAKEGKNDAIKEQSPAMKGPPTVPLSYRHAPPPRLLPHYPGNPYYIYTRRRLPYTPPAVWPTPALVPLPSASLSYTRTTPDLAQGPQAMGAFSPASNWTPDDYAGNQTTETSQIPKVSPVAEDRPKSPALDVQEETAIRAMLSLHRTGSGSSLEPHQHSPQAEQWKSGRACTSIPV